MRNLMRNIIQVKNFAKSFGSKVVLIDVSFDVKKGECLGLIGGSGVGKSVILRSLVGLEKSDRGKIIINNEEITQFSEEQLIEVRKSIAYVFQGGALFDSMSVFDNLAYSLREHTDFTEDTIENKIDNQLKEFGLEGNKDVFPAELSGGMQKRVGLARSIIMAPQIILYDEPTAGLDPYNTKKIQEMILRLKSKGATSILVTHDMPSAFAVCDRIILLLKGYVAEQRLQKHINSNIDGPIHRFINGEES